MGRKSKADPNKPKKPRKPKKPLSDNTLIKAALRKAFARCSVHRELVESTIMPEGHSDPNRKQVKTWCRPPCCNQPEAKSYIQVDHLSPVQPLGVHIDEMTKEEIMARIFCDRANLKPICKKCHRLKTNAENAERRKLRSAKKACASGTAQGIVDTGIRGENNVKAG